MREEGEGVNGEALDPDEARDVDLGWPVLGLGLLALLGFSAAAVFASRRRSGDATGGDPSDPQGGTP